MNHRRAVLLVLCIASGAWIGAIAQADSDGAAPGPDGSASGTSYQWPQQRESEGYAIVLHAPQIRKWPDFKTFEALIALELTPPGASEPVYGTASISGSTEVDIEQRIVTVGMPKIGEVLFPADSPQAYVTVVKNLSTRQQLKIPLDLFLAQLADDVLSEPPPAGFNTKPPAIYVASTPTMLFLVNGSPAWSPIADSGLEILVNANWPVFQAASTKGSYYLLYRQSWLTSKHLDRGWERATSLPTDFAKLPTDEEFKAVHAALPLEDSSAPVPRLIYTDQPAELIVTDGPAMLESIPGTGGLEHVTNTQSPLFRLQQTWYFLVAGRWFSTNDLQKGPWTYSAKLPEAFSKIPDDHAMASVLASVPGTVEAKMAALEALLPTRKQAEQGEAPPVQVSYAGAPEFQPISGTQVSRAVNSEYDVIQYGSTYYLCYGGIWYQAASPQGPWAATASVPGAIYAIPPSSPVYNVTEVKVASVTDSTIVYQYPASYASGVYVVYGVPYYGTGWYYPPYIHGGYYYPYWGSYGHGSWYNPATGGYGSRSVWYGPYGGYSYTQGYNPTTGRRGYMETSWNGDKWNSYSSTYNPRTGVGMNTSRAYNADSGKSQMNRTTQRGNTTVSTQRNTDWDDGTSQVKRTTSEGGQSQMNRQLSDGTLSSSGTVKTADGRSFSVEGEQTRQGGSSTITGSEGSADLNTRRSDGRSVTGIQGSDGGQGISVSGQGPGRTTVGQSSNGDLYAGHDGNVFRKTDDGWQHYDNGGWNSVDTPSGGSAGQALQQRDSNFGGQFGGRDDMSQLNRDYSARQMGGDRFAQRGGGFGGGGFGGGGFRGGGFRGRR